MRRHRCPFLVATVILAAAGAVLYAFAAAATWDRIAPHALAIEVGAGTLAGMGALVCWAVKRREDGDRRRAQADEDKATLIRTLAALVPAARAELRRTKPLRRVP